MNWLSWCFFMLNSSVACSLASLYTLLPPYLGGTLALAGAVHAGAAATLLQLLALVQLGAVCRGVALPGLLHAVMFNTEAVVWVVSISYSL